MINQICWLYTSVINSPIRALCKEEYVYGHYKWVWFWPGVPYSWLCTTTWLSLINEYISIQDTDQLPLLDDKDINSRNMFVKLSPLLNYHTCYSIFYPLGSWIGCRDDVSVIGTENGFNKPHLKSGQCCLHSFHANVL